MLRCGFVSLVTALLLSAVVAGCCFGSGEPVRGFRRATFWFVEPGRNTDEIEARAEALARSAVDWVIIGGGRHHYLHDDLPFLDDYITAAKRIVSACRARGIKVVEHHSAVLTADDGCVRERADWLQRDFETNEPSVWPEYRTFAFCPNNPAFREHYFGLAERITAAAGVDGLMSDDTVFHHGCRCAACARRWSEEVGGDIEEAYKNSRTPGSAEWRRFNEVRRMWYADFRAWLCRGRKERQPNTVCVSLAGSITSPWGSQTHGGSPEAALDTSDICVWEIYNPADFYSWRRLAAEAAVFAEAARVRKRAAVCLPYADSAERRDRADEQEEVFMWALAQSHRLRFALSRVFLTGLTEDQPPREYFLFEREHPDLFADAEPAAAVGIIFSHVSRDLDPHWESSHTVPAVAWAEALQDECVPWRAITEETLGRGLPRNLRVLVMPNVFALSDAHLGVIEEFVRRGGTLVATGNLAACSERGENAVSVRGGRLERLLGARVASADGASGGQEAESHPTRRVEPRFLEHGFGLGRVLYSPSVIERDAFQDWMNPGEQYRDDRNRTLSRELAEIVRRDSRGQPVDIARTNPDLHVLTTVHKQGRRLLISILNCSGADLSNGRRVPAPSRVVWGPPFDLELTFPKAPRGARLVSLDAREDRSFVNPDRTLTLRSPRRFGVLVVDL